MSLPDSQTVLPRVLKTAALQIARLRSLLDWALAVPAWERAIAAALKELEISGRRQGVSLATALRSLPIERKQALVKTVLAKDATRLSFQDAKRLARLAGIEFRVAGKSFDSLPQWQWDDFRRRVILRIAARYEHYKAAQHELFARYYPLSAACCARWVSNASIREDACQEARLALLEAIDRIDPNANFKAYARTWILRRVRNFLMQERVPVKAPVNVVSEALRSDRNSTNSLSRALREGTVQLDDPNQAEKASSGLRSCDSEEPAQVATSGDELALVRRALTELTDKQREVVEYRFGIGEQPTALTLAEIAEKTGISRQQVFQREKRALQKLQLLLAPLREEGELVLAAPPRS